MSGPQQPLLNQSSSTLLTRRPLILPLRLRPLCFYPSDSDSGPSTSTPQTQPLSFSPSDPPTPPPPHLPLRPSPLSFFPLQLRPLCFYPSGPFACTPPTQHITVYLEYSVDKCEKNVETEWNYRVRKYCSKTVSFLSRETGFRRNSETVICSVLFRLLRKN